jgi:hypothetical protein
MNPFDKNYGLSAALAAQRDIDRARQIADPLFGNTGLRQLLEDQAAVKNLNTLASAAKATQPASLRGIYLAQQACQQADIQGLFGRTSGEDALAKALKGAQADSIAVEHLKLAGIANGITQPSYLNDIYLERQATQLDGIESLLGPAFARDSLLELTRALSAPPTYAVGSTTADYLELTKSASSVLAAAATIKMQDAQYKPYIDAMEAFHLATPRLVDTLAGMKSAWAQQDDLVGSAMGVAQVSALLQGAVSLRPYDDPFTQFTRFEFGDYREELRWDRIPLTDVEVRRDFYRDHGYRSDIAEVRQEAVEECADTIEPHVPGADKSPLPFNVLLSCQSSSERQQAAFLSVMLIEQALRKLILERMTSVYGSKWVKTHLKGNIRTQWEEKQATAVKAGRPKDPLIHYADFTDYALIITGDAAWRDAFGKIFDRAEGIRESLHRLNVVRLVVCHSRELLPMDLMLLAVEGTRLLRAIEQAEDSPDPTGAEDH